MTSKHGTHLECAEAHAMHARAHAVVHVCIKVRREARTPSPSTSANARSRVVAVKRGTMSVALTRIVLRAHHQRKGVCTYACTHVCMYVYATCVCNV